MKRGLGKFEMSGVSVDPDGFLQNFVATAMAKTRERVSSLGNHRSTSPRSFALRIGIGYFESLL